MTPLVDVMAECRLRGVTLHSQGGRLTFEPQSAMTPALADKLREHKQELLTLLASQSMHTRAPDRGNAPAPRPDRPEYGCWNCGSREFARSLAGNGWVCANCHPPGELRAHVERWTAPRPSRSGWGAALEARRVEKREVQAKLAAAAARVRAGLAGGGGAPPDEDQASRAELAAFFANRRGDRA